MPAERGSGSEEFSSSAAQKKTEQESAQPVTANMAASSLTPAPQVKPSRPFVLYPVAALNWDGNWPALAATLPVRGVAQQLAQQSELINCGLGEGNQIQFDLQVAVDVLLANGSVEKLTTALSEHFGQTVRVQTKGGSVEHTANAAALVDRAERQRDAEKSMQEDPFVQKLMREFGATIVSVKPV